MFRSTMCCTNQNSLSAYRISVSIAVYAIFLSRAVLNPDVDWAGQRYNFVNKYIMETLVNSPEDGVSKILLHSIVDV